MAVADVFAALALLEELGAPPHLVRHHELVAEAAAELVHGLHRFREFFDARVVLIGAALHDAGKILHPGEMSGPGSRHELDGERLLRDHGFGELARFAVTHAQWKGEDIGLEDLLVALADCLWKGKRIAELERRVVEELAKMSGEEADDLFERVAAGSDRRLARSGRTVSDVDLGADGRSHVGR